MVELGLVNGPAGIEATYARPRDGVGAGAETQQQRAVPEPAASESRKADNGKMPPGQKEEDAKQGVQREEDLTRLTDMMNEAASAIDRHVRFRLYKDVHPNVSVIEVVDTQKDEVIRKIPPEEFLKAAARIEKMIGLIINEMA
ncbi:MAG: flagellar protein FlaG [Candidatus Schekmanbacteria bacterium]|nr:flagellar protein FlaG [Candidatus Schekmanbacteria bacterium]